MEPGIDDDRKYVLSSLASGATGLEPNMYLHSLFSSSLEISFP